MVLMVAVLLKLFSSRSTGPVRAVLKEAQKGGTLVVGMSGDPQTLTPPLGLTTTSGVSRKMYSRLVS